MVLGIHRGRRHEEELPGRNDGIGRFDSGDRRLMENICDRTLTRSANTRQVCDDESHCHSGGGNTRRRDPAATWCFHHRS